MKRIFTIGCGLFFLSNLLLGQSRPYISNLDKTSAAAGEKLSISGINFPTNPADVQVNFGGEAGTVLTTSENLIEVTVPAGATFGPVSVVDLGSNLIGFSSEAFFPSFGGSGFDKDAMDDPEVFSPSQNGMYDLCVCDFDGDGKPDVASSQDGSQVTRVPVFANNSTVSTLSFTTTNQPSLTINESSFNVTCGDLDGDGKPDLLATRALAGATPGDVVFIFRNNSTGAGNVSFDTPTSVTLPADNSGNKKNVARVAINDIDGDGRPEIIATNEVDGHIDIFQNTSTTGSIQFKAESLQFPSGGNKSFGLDVKDLNSDGFPEIIVNGLQQSDIFVLPNVSSPGTINFNTAVEVDVAGQLVNLIAGDFNGDGLADIAATQVIENKIIVVLNETSDVGGQIRFGSAISFDVSSRPWGIDAGDVNGDGKLDILTSSTSSNTVSILTNTTGQGISFSRSDIPAGQATRNVKIADVNSDGKPDLLAAGITESELVVIANRNCVQPSLSLSAATVCLNTDMDLEATETVGHTYIWYSSSTEDGTYAEAKAESTESFFDLSTLPVGEIFLKVEILSDDDLCSETSAAAALTVINSPAPSPNVIANPAPICEGSTLEIDGTVSSGAKTYEWSGPNGFSSSEAVLQVDNFDASKAGTYTFRYTTDDGCLSPPQDVKAEAISLPAISVRYTGNGLFCQDATVNIAAADYADYDYQWYREGEIISGQTATSYIASSSGAYAIELTDPSTNCVKVSEALDLTEVDKPATSFTSADVICVDVPLDVEATSTGAENLTLNYSWDFDEDGTTDSSDTTTSFTYSGADEYTIVLTTGYDEIENCETSLSKDIIVRAVPTLTIEAPDGTQKCPEESVDLSVEEQYVSYEWSTSATTAAISVQDTGTYTITVVDDAQCTISASVEVTNFDTSSSITLTANRAVIDEMDTTQLVVTGASVIQSWDPTTGMDDPTSAAPIVTGTYVEEDFNFLVNGLREYTYVVSVLDMNGCEVTASVNLSVIPEDSPAPMKSFSPNGDGIDDVWKVDNVEFNQSCKLVIYDRRGRVILQKEPYNNDWDGRINGNPAEQGVYYYVFICEDPGLNRNGSILLFR